MYVVNGNVYKFNTIHTLYIYDFDRSYSEKFGINDLLNHYDNCRYGSQCNYIISSGNKDFFKVFCYIYKILKNLSGFSASDFKFIMDSLAKNSENKKKLKKIYKFSCFFDDLLRQIEDPVKDLIYEEDFFSDGLYNIEEIIKNFGEEITQEVTVLDEDIFMINKDYFNNIGELDINKVKNDRKEFLKKLEPSVKPISVKEEPLAIKIPSVKEEPLAIKIPSVKPISVREPPIKPISIKEEPLAIRIPSAKPISFKEEPLVPFIKSYEIPSKYLKIPKGLVASQSNKRFVPRSTSLREIILSQIKKTPTRKNKKSRRSKKSRKRSNKSCKKSRRRSKKPCKKSRRRSKKSGKRSKKIRQVTKDVIKYINKEIKRSRRRV
jgi:hypothetical protein